MDGSETQIGVERPCGKESEGRRGTLAVATGLLALVSSGSRPLRSHRRELGLAHPESVESHCLG
jgi:hypothetical protein